LNDIQSLEKAGLAGKILAIICVMYWTEGYLIKPERYKRFNNTNSIIPPWKSKSPLMRQRPDAWRARLVQQFPEFAKALEELLEAASEKPVSRSPRRIARDQRDTERPNRRPSRG
jgi:hypothetical protein